MRWHLLQYINRYLRLGRRTFNLRINRWCILWAPKALLLLSQCDPWKHEHVYILWISTTRTHSNFLCLRIVLLSVNLGGKNESTEDDFTTKECNKISTTWMWFFWIFHCFTRCFLYNSRNFRVSAQQAGSRNNVIFFWSNGLWLYTYTGCFTFQPYLYLSCIFSIQISFQRRLVPCREKINIRTLTSHAIS